MPKLTQAPNRNTRPCGEAITIRVTPEALTQLNRLARQRGTSRANLSKQLLEQALGMTKPHADNPQVAVVIRAINSLSVCMADVAAAQRDMPIADIAASTERIENLLRALTKIIYIPLYNTDTLTALVAQEGTPIHTRIQRDNIRLAEESVPLLIQKALLMGSPTE